MSVLSEILQEEYKRLLSTIASYEKLSNEMPKGSIILKHINGIEYPYLQWREGNKVKSKYLRQDEIEQFREQIERRKQYEKSLREMYLSKKEFDKVIGKEI
jgi:hypothetical protein